MPKVIPRLLATVALLASFTVTDAAESIISKVDVERIFAMRKAEWEEYAPRIADPKWKIRLRQMDTGTGVMAFDPSTGTGLSVQPLYIDDKSPPTMLVVGSFYPPGKVPAKLAASQRHIEQEAQRDLGQVIPCRLDT